jgi:hypothetical protein
MESDSRFNMIAKHLQLLTADFRQSNHPWKKVSKWAGYSGILYLLPIYFITARNVYASVYKLLWIVQTVFVISSDYVAAGPEPHVLHGVDRLLATAMVISAIGITAHYLSPAFALAGSLLPLFFVYQSMMAAKERNWDKYVLNHTLWHITGPIIVSYAFHKIESTRPLFD